MTQSPPHALSAKPTHSPASVFLAVVRRWLKASADNSGPASTTETQAKPAGQPPLPQPASDMGQHHRLLMAQKAIITDMRAKAKRQHRATSAYDAMLRRINAEILGGGK